MDSIILNGGAVLEGTVTLGGSKNAALPVIVSSLLSAGKCSYRRVPALRDVSTTLRLLSRLGVTIEKDLLADGHLELTADKIHELEAPYDLVKTMRASFLVLGPLLGAVRRGAGIHPRRLRHRLAAGGPAPPGTGAHGRVHPPGPRLRRGADEGAQGRRHRPRLPVGGRHREPHDGRHPGPGRDRDPQCGAASRRSSSWPRC